MGARPSNHQSCQKEVVAPSRIVQSVQPLKADQELKTPSQKKDFLMDMDELMKIKIKLKNNNMANGPLGRLPPDPSRGTNSMSLTSFK